jgi:hypothetical protein
MGRLSNHSVNQHSVYDLVRNGDLLMIKLLRLTMSVPLIASRYGFLPHIDACVTKKYPVLDCPHAATGARGM